MSYQSIFRRFELKYLITNEQKRELLKLMDGRMKIDDYGKTTIRNLYFDTDNYRLIRHSIEKPPYKEKLRFRSYNRIKEDDDVFVELKKKYKSVVYKRRIVLPYNEAYDWVCGKKKHNISTQIEKEIEYFRVYYESLKPHVYLSYDREAYYSLEEYDFRVTFDDNIVWRQENLSLCEEAYGQKIIEDGQVIMEIKTSKAIPLWLSHKLSEMKVYKTQFSKYGHAYEEFM